MTKLKIQQVFMNREHDYLQRYTPSKVQEKALHSIMNCKTGKLGYNLSVCLDCGTIEVHNNSCRNRNCPNCQAIKKGDLDRSAPF